MFKYFNNIILALFILLVPFNSQTQTSKIKIRLEISGLKNNNGVVRTLIFNQKNQNGYPDDSTRASFKQIIAISGGKAVAEFDGVEEGIYAISAHHDENQDGKVNANFIGFPTERVAFSNNAKIKFSAPSFSEAQILINKDNKVIKINMSN